MAAPHGPEGVASNLELRLLRAAGEHAQRVHATQKACAVGTSVSYDTLSSFAGRVRYITTLKEVRTSPVCPLLLKIEDIPQGVNLGRLGEIMNMVAVPNVRFLLEFSERIPEMEFKLGAAGIGVALPDDCSPNKAESILEKPSRTSCWGSRPSASCAGCIRPPLFAWRKNIICASGSAPRWISTIAIRDWKRFPTFP